MKNNCVSKVLMVMLSLLVIHKSPCQETIFLEAESFEETGAWKIDQQSFDVMGSSYLLAHGMGKPVGDASTTLSIVSPGTYWVWVRTKDWAPFPKGPGAFRIKFDGLPLGDTLGVSGIPGWRWYEVGRIQLSAGLVNLSLSDLSGFDGRVDAIVLSKDHTLVLPNERPGLDDFRAQYLGDIFTPIDEGPFDLVVVGGGMAGTCAAIAAARNGVKVALVQNRPVLGGNNSSEVRVHLMGNWDRDNKYTALGRIVRELDNGDPGNGNPVAKAYGDQRKLGVVQAERNLHLFLNTHVFAAETNDGHIVAVTGRDIRTNQNYRFAGKYFADCTGDGTVGFLAGADFRMGRESRAETGEALAPLESDDFTLGTSNLWASLERAYESDFPECPWALPFSEEYYIDEPKSDWQWETGFGNFNTITEAEEIRDHNLRAIYGNWSFLKNHKRDKYARHELAWVSYVGGKRESRRLMGDHILTQMDIQDSVQFEDGMVTATWTIDLHFPQEKNSQFFKGQEFFAATKHIRVKPYQIPYRCLYSRNIDNLFMAGRDISTTHVAFGSTRVMRTCGMMGEVVGYAASLAKKYNTSPRGIYQDHLGALIGMVSGERVIKP